MRIVLCIQYDGTNFLGWQLQPNKKTIQNHLEIAIKKFTNKYIKTIVAGRTDSKVHGLRQIVHFDTDIDRKETSWVNGINYFLPKTIVIQWVKFVSNKFHARFSAIERVYYYLIYINKTKLPILKNYAGWINFPINIKSMIKATKLITGKHNFSSFKSSKCQSTTPIKIFNKIDIILKNNFVYFRFKSNAFLYKMIRIIISSLILIGKKTYPINWLLKVLKKKNRKYASYTFIPNGLYLAYICYPKHFHLPGLLSLTTTWEKIWIK